MELFDIYQKATTPIGSGVLDPYFRGAEMARAKQLGEIQNASQALGLQRSQALQNIAPQLGQAVSSSGMPFAEQFGMLVQADPTKAEFALREGMDFQQAQAKRMALQDPVNAQIVNDAREHWRALQESALTLLDPKAKQADREISLKAYKAAYEEYGIKRAELSLRVQNSSLLNDMLPRPAMTPSEIALKAEDQGFKRESALQEKELFPFKKQNMIADTAVKSAGAQDITRKTTAGAVADMKPYTELMDEMAGLAEDLGNIARDLKSSDDQTVKAALADLTKRKSRMASNEALSEADFGRAAGASNFKSALDALLKTDFAQMNEKQAKTIIADMLTKTKKVYDVSRSRARQVAGNQPIVAMEFPSNLLPKSGGGGGSSNKAQAGSAPKAKIDFSKFKK